MSILLKLALVLSILGALQVYSVETKCEEETRCSEGKGGRQVGVLYEAYHNSCNDVNEAMKTKEKGIKYLQNMLELTYKYNCDCNDKKCLERLYVMMKSAKILLAEYLQQISYKYLESVTNLVINSAYALDEISSCYCNINICVKKIEYPVVKYIGEKKEYKCTDKNVLTFLLDIPKYLERLETSLSYMRNIIRCLEEIKKLKEELVKGSKCGEKDVATLEEYLVKLNIYSSKLTYLEIELQQFDHVVLALLNQILSTKECKK